MEKLSEAASRVVIARPRRGRGALSAQREEVPLGCNLGKALAARTDRRYMVCTSVGAGLSPPGCALPTRTGYR